MSDIWSSGIRNRTSLSDFISGEHALSGIMRLVAAAQASGSRTQALADRAAAILFYVAVASGVITFIYWWFSGDKEHALIRTSTVLIIACPHALGLAIPLVIAISTSLGAQNGLLVKDRLALERARNLDVVIFDKTGTLTRGSPAVSEVAAVAGTNESDLLAHAAAVEVRKREQGFYALEPQSGDDSACRMARALNEAGCQISDAG